MAQPLGGCGFLGDQANRLGVEAKEKMNRRTATPCELKRRASVPIDAATPAAVKHLRQYYKTRNHRSSSWPPSPSTTQATPMLFEKVAVENADQRSSSALSLSRSELSNSGHSSGGYINSLRTKALHYLVTASPTCVRFPLIPRCACVRHTAAPARVPESLLAPFLVVPVIVSHVLTNPVPVAGF